MPLTTLGIKAARPGLHADTGKGSAQGLYLRVTESGARSWVFRYQKGGARHSLGLGSVARMGLKEAREKAAALRLLLRAGRDPMADRRAPEGLMFREVAERYLAAHEAGWRNPKHRQQWHNTLGTYAYPVAGEVQISAIDTGVQCVQTKKPAPTSATTTIPANPRCW